MQGSYEFDLSKVVKNDKEIHYDGFLAFNRLAGLIVLNHSNSIYTMGFDYSSDSEEVLGSIMGEWPQNDGLKCFAVSVKGSLLALLSSNKLILFEWNSFMNNRQPVWTVIVDDSWSHIVFSKSDDVICYGGNRIGIFRDGKVVKDQRFDSPIVNVDSFPIGVVVAMLEDSSIMVVDDQTSFTRVSSSIASSYSGCAICCGDNQHILAVYCNNSKYCYCLYRYQNEWKEEIMNDVCCIVGDVGVEYKSCILYEPSWKLFIIASVGSSDLGLIQIRDDGYEVFHDIPNACTAMNEEFESEKVNSMDLWRISENSRILLMVCASHQVYCCRIDHEEKDRKETIDNDISQMSVSEKKGEEIRKRYECIEALHKELGNADMEKGKYYTQLKELKEQLSSPYIKLMKYFDDLVVKNPAFKEYLVRYAIELARSDSKSIQGMISAVMDYCEGCLNNQEPCYFTYNDIYQLKQLYQAYIDSIQSINASQISVDSIEGGESALFPSHEIVMKYERTESVEEEEDVEEEGLCEDYFYALSSLKEGEYGLVKKNAPRVLYQKKTIYERMKEEEEEEKEKKRREEEKRKREEEEKRKREEEKRKEEEEREKKKEEEEKKEEEKRKKEEEEEKKEKNELIVVSANENQPPKSPPSRFANAFGKANTKPISTEESTHSDATTSAGGNAEVLVAQSTNGITNSTTTNGGLFGNTAKGNGLFGKAANASASSNPTAMSSGLFGGTSTKSNSLFGGNPAPQDASTNSVANRGMFSGNPTTPNKGLFTSKTTNGAVSNQNLFSSAATPSKGLFGNASSSSSLFSTSSLATPSNSGGLFGQSNKGGTQPLPSQNPPKLNPQIVLQLIQQFYQKYSPSKINDVPGIVKKYEGRELLLCQKLEQKYCGGQPILQQQLFK